MSTVYDERGLAPFLEVARESDLEYVRAFMAHPDLEDRDRAIKTQHGSGAPCRPSLNPMAGGLLVMFHSAEYREVEDAWHDWRESHRCKTRREGYCNGSCDTPGKPEKPSYMGSDAPIRVLVPWAKLDAWLAGEEVEERPQEPKRTRRSTAPVQAGFWGDAVDTSWLDDDAEVAA